ncbi:MAG: tRNA lysidine(34) synthetase TilS, partial [Dehalococcoidales bacterium]|nr:tRNA lysidine(34) synthetase TilS [Dehalococcoidales bacterium]
LLRSYNPRITEALLRTARIAAEDIAFIDKETERLWAGVSRPQENTIALDKARFLRLPLALQRHLLRRAIEELLGNLKDIERRHIEVIMAALMKPVGRRLNLPGGLIFSVEYDRYLLGPDREALVPFPALDAGYPLQIPGETILPGWRIEADIVERAESRGEDDFAASFDLDKTGDQLSVRPRQSGDRFQPLGMSQSKTLGEFMIDAKIPAAWRERIPIICSLQQIIWVVGWRIDDRVKITEGTKRVLRLKFERDGDPS